MPLDLQKFGVATPGLTLMPGAGSEWERDAPFTDLAATVAAADRLGFYHATCSEHIGVPADQAPRRGARYYDPLASFGYLAAITRQIRFLTSVLVLGYHHPLEIAKRYGTLDVVSGGRVILGLGVGSLKEEFDLLGLGGAEFRERGARGDDALRALRAVLGRPEPEYHGPYYDFGGLVVDPCAPRTDVPLWIGGRSMRSLRRAVELADGWTPFGLKLEELGEMIARAKETSAWAGRSQPIEIVLPSGEPLDPSGAPARALEVIDGLFGVGATRVSLRLAARSAAHYVEQLEAFAALEA